MNAQESASKGGASDVFGCSNVDQVLDLLPRVISAMVEGAPCDLGVSAGAAVVAAIGQLSAALGGSHMLHCGGLKFPAQFNLLMVADYGVSVDWLSRVAQPVIESAEQAIRVRASANEGGCLKRFLAIERLVVTSHLFGLRGADEQSLAYYRRMRAVHRPQILCWGNAHVAMVNEALRDSYDRTVCICNGAVDPIVEWQKLSRKNAEELLRLLLHSWTLKPLPAGIGGESVPATLHMIAGTAIDAASRWLQESRNWLDRQSVPILLFQQQGVPHWLRRESAGQESMFHILLKRCDEGRRNALRPTIWRLDDDAATVLIDFQKDFRRRSQSLPADEQKEVHWIPDLCLRLNLLFAVADVEFREGAKRAGHDQQTSPRRIGLKVSERAVVVTRWFAANHLKTLRLLKDEATGSQAPSRARGVGATDIPDSADMTDTCAIESAICDKLRARGPLSRRELLRMFHKLNAETRDLAVKRLRGRGLITESADRKLMLGAAELQKC